MSDNAIIAENQQGRLRLRIGEPSETTRQTPVRKRDILAYLHGALHDATLNKGKRIRFAQKEVKWLELLQRLLRSIECNSWIYREGKTRTVYVLETLCKSLNFQFDPNTLRTTSEKAFYLKGFFDAEGGIPRNGKRFYIQLVQKDRIKMEKIKNIARDIGIFCGDIHNPSRKIDPNYWRVFVRAQSWRVFAQKVGSLHPVKAKIFSQRMKI